MKISFISNIACPFLIIIFFVGCKKDVEETTDNDTSSAIDHSFAESTYDDVGSISDQAAISGILSTYKLGYEESLLMAPCATISIDTSVSPKMLTVDFGPTNCECLDKRLRRGKIIIEFTGLYRDSASSHTISFDNYYVENYKVGGTKTVTNGGHNAKGNLFYSIDVAGIITSPAGNKLDWQSNRIREWVAGEGTPGWSDDIYEISGSANGNSFLGNDFTANITSPLEVALNCRWIKEGDLEFTPSGKHPRFIDYGYPASNCDRQAKVTVAGYDFIVIMR